MPARYYLPTTDIYETEDALTVVMELPGVERQAVDVNVENNVLRVEGGIQLLKVRGPGTLVHRIQCRAFRPGSFTLSNKMDQQQISAQLDDGVLTLTLRKAEEALPRRIAIN